MKESQKLVISLLDEIAKRFNGLSLQYMFSAPTKQHIIEVQPEVIYNSDEYLEFESDIISQFIDQFPEEGLLFTSSDPYIKVSNPVYFTNRETRRFHTKSNFTDGSAGDQSFDNEITMNIGIAELFENIEYAKSVPIKQLNTNFDDELNYFDQGNELALVA